MIIFSTKPSLSFLDKKAVISNLAQMNYNFKDKTILFAEDDEASSVYLTELLRLNGARVVNCSSGSAAVAICLESHSLDLVLMDMRLPELDGYEATRTIKNFRPDLPIIAVTACAMLEDRRKCKIAGCDGYLSKPVMPKEFLPMVNSFLFPEKIRSLSQSQY